MKKIILPLCFIVSLCIANSAWAQPLLLETTDVNNRFMLKLNYPSNSTQSSAGIQIKAGTLTNESNAEIASWSNSYIATPGYAGYAGFTNSNSGLMLRAQGANGKIRFLTGGATVTTHTRVTIDNTGNMGLGTSDPSSKLQLETGDVYVKEIGSGLILKSANGSCWRLSVDNSGTVASQSVSCPL